MTVSLSLAADNMGPNPADRLNVDPLRILATVAACYDTADQIREARENVDPTADPADLDLDRDDLDRDDLARLVAYRVMSAADRLARSAHTWWHGDRVTGDTDPVTAEPDPYDRVKSRTRPVRTRKGRTTVEVGRHGRSYVVGGTVGRPSHDATMSTAVLSNVLRTVPSTSTGAADGISVSRVTAVAFPDLPRLVGADTVAWEESQTAEPVRAGKYRPVRFPTRYELPGVGNLRGGEQSAVSVTFYDGQTVTRLLAPSDLDLDHAWQGHVLITRPTTVRAARSAKVKKVDRAVTVPTTAVLADVLAGECATVPTVPYRVTWSQTTADGEIRHGAITVSGSTDRRRFSVSGLAAPVKNLATADGIRAAVARVESTSTSTR